MQRYAAKGALTGVLLCGLALGVAGVEEGLSPEAKDIQLTLRQFEAEDWGKRYQAFYDLIGLGGDDGSSMAQPLTDLLRKYPDHAEAIRVGLVKLLERENAKVRQHEEKKTKWEPGYSDYYANVIAAVVTLKDVRSMGALLGAITTGGMATRTLAEFAPLSLDPVLAKLHDPDPHVRGSALHALRAMLKEPNYEKVKDPIYRSKIKQALVKAISDQDPSVRSAGVRALATTGDTDVIPLLEKVARNDPAFLPGQAEGGKDLYFVRHAAKMALAELRSKRRKPRQP